MLLHCASAIDTTLVARIRNALDVCYRDAVVVGVSYDLVLDFLPALEGFVHQDLGCVSKRLCDQRDQLFFVVGKPGAQSTEREGRADQDRIAEPLGGGYGLRVKKSWC